MGDDDRYTILGKAPHGRAFAPFGGGVDRGGRVIENDHWRLKHHRAGNREALALAARKGDARSRTTVL